MIIINWRKLGLRRKTIYFYNNEEIELSDINDFVSSISKPNDGSVEERYTLTTDLDEDINEIESKIDKQFRYEIRRAKEKDELSIQFYDAQSISKKVLKIFVTFFNLFAKQKGLPKCDVKLLNNALKNNCIVLSTIKKDKEYLVWHAYIAKDEQTRFLYSCSLFRNMDNQYKNLVGRANKYLHWSDFIEFKSRKYKLYDWGGAGKKDDVKSITDFKNKFGGVEQIRYTYRMTSNSKWLKFLTKIKNFIKGSNCN